jgi:hypothetical protein
MLFLFWLKSTLINVHEMQVEIEELYEEKNGANMIPLIGINVQAAEN